MSENIISNHPEESIQLYRELVMLVNGGERTTSRKIAKKFNKRHDHVLGVIDKLIFAIDSMSPNTGRLNFIDSSYVDGQGRVYREFEITKDGFALLAMRFTGIEALKWQIRFIAAFNWLAVVLLEREENQRLMDSFDIKNRGSESLGSFHGTGLQKRKVEKKTLKAEALVIESKVQGNLALLN